MMYIQKMTLGYTRTVNLGDYNSIKLSMMPTVTIEDCDDIDQVLRDVWAMCRANVEHATGPIVTGYNVGELHGLTTEELFLGIPIDTKESTDDAD